ncbi:nardilysin-like isoform X1 [Selaginella moellendorffii]|nr:nardilysin-like isoform X1 [Selaginella moellendorffii]|eukprot:XP_024542665.1 nardilysin-like isoform X1 [Selaginella moellendorffii]
MGCASRASKSGHCKPPFRLFGGKIHSASVIPRHSSVSAAPARSLRNSMVSEVAVVKSPSDKRDYEIVHLRNGLSALLIHDSEIKHSVASVEKAPLAASSEESDYDDDEDDEEDDEEEEEEEDMARDEVPEDGKKRGGMAQAKKAAAAMCVSVGSFSDPKDAEGLAHFLEHMLFMGSSKFPDENEYAGFLAEHGGSSNAFTEMEYTCYHFDVNHMYLKPALERFSQFFISPLVKGDSIEREVQAVDSEFVQALQNDGCRLNQLKCHTADLRHPYNRFSWGNAKSLGEAITKCTDIRQKLIEFYKQHYLANRMKLVVLGGEPLATLKEWVTELFEDIPEGSSKPQRFSWNGPVWPAGKIYHVESVKDQHRLILSWVMPCLHTEYLKKPHDYLSHLIGHEGKGSLLQFLKANGWATDLAAGVSEDDFEKSTAGYLFSVCINLTVSGLGKIHEIVGKFFEFVKLLRDSKPQEWIFEELHAVSAMDFRFVEEEPADDYVSTLAKNMHLFPEHHVIYGDYAHDQWDPKLAEELLNYLSPMTMRVDIVTKSFNKDAPDVVFEPWFGTPYVVNEAPKDLLNGWLNPLAVNDALHLPAVNEFISRDFSIKSADDSNVLPVVIAEDSSVKVWHKLDRTFQTPRANVFMKLSCRMDGLRSEVLTSLYTLLLKDALNETIYMATVAGLSSSVVANIHNIEFKVHGYNEKLGVLAQQICQLLKALVPANDRFEVAKEQYERLCRNARVKPMTHSAALRVQILRMGSWSEEERLAYLSTLSAEDVRNFIPQLFREAHVEALCHGNLTKEEALDIVNVVKSTVVTVPMLEETMPKIRIVKIPSQTDFAYNVPVVNPLEENSVAELYFQMGLDLGAESVREHVLGDLFEHMVYEPFFNQLRTIEQLGYRVDCGTRYTYGVLGFCFRIMSSKYSPTHIHKRIEDFIDKLQKTLDDMSEEVFDNYKNCLIAEKMEKDKCLSDETDRHWGHVLDQRYLFDAHEKEAVALKDIKKEDVVEWYKQHIRAGGSMRRSLCIHVWGCQFKDEMQKNKNKRNKRTPYRLIEDIDEFKNKAELYPPFP